MRRGILAGALWGALIGAVVVALFSQIAAWRDLTPAVTQDRTPAPAVPGPATDGAADAAPEMAAGDAPAPPPDAPRIAEGAVADDPARVPASPDRPATGDTAPPRVDAPAAAPGAQPADTTSTDATQSGVTAPEAGTVGLSPPDGDAAPRIGSAPIASRAPAPRVVADAPQAVPPAPPSATAGGAAAEAGGTPPRAGAAPLNAAPGADDLPAAQQPPSAPQVALALPRGAPAGAADRGAPPVAGGDAAPRTQAVPAAPATGAIAPGSGPRVPSPPGGAGVLTPGRPPAEPAIPESDTPPARASADADSAPVVQPAPAGRPSMPGGADPAAGDPASDLPGELAALDDTARPATPAPGGTRAGAPLGTDDPDPAAAPPPPPAGIGAGAPPAAETAPPATAPEAAPETAPAETPRVLRPKRLTLPQGTTRMPGRRVAGLPSIGDDAETGGDAAAPAAADPTAPALVRNRAEVTLPEGAALVAVVLIHDDPAGPVPAVADLPPEISVAVPAGLLDATAIARAYRAQGREVALILDLPPAATARDVEVAMPINLDKLPVAVAVMSAGPDGFQADHGAIESVVAASADAGLGVLVWPGGLDTTRRIAARDGVPAATLLGEIPPGLADSRALERMLEQAGFRARRDGAVVIAAPAGAAVAEGLRAWARAAGRDGLALAPLSAVLTADRPAP